MALNENIRKFRKEAGLTQKDLAGKSGLSYSMICKLESGGQANPSFETIRRIADVLKISPGELVNPPLTIEDQIDEYIEYKRGLGESISRISPNEKSTVPALESAYSDLNFKKRLQAINGIAIPPDEANDEYLDFINRRPEMKKLLLVLKSATKDEINEITRLVETFRGSMV